MEENLNEKHESDLTKKEKRLIMRQKFRKMPFKKKLEYIWMYEKPFLIGIVVALILFLGAAEVYQSSKTEYVLNVSIVSAGEGDADALKQEITDCLEITKAHEEVSVSTNLATDGDTGKFAYYAQISFVGELQAKSLDVMIMPEELYQNLTGDGYFADLRAVLGETVYDSFGEAADGDCIRIRDGIIGNSFRLPYENACVVVISNSPNQENAARWISSLAE